MAKEGWICPRCGNVNAPWVPECKCNQVRTMNSTNYTVQIGDEIKHVEKINDAPHYEDLIT